MRRAYVYVMFLAIIVAVIYAYYSMPQKPETGMMYTPKQYIERVEQEKRGELEKQGHGPDSRNSD